MAALHIQLLGDFRLTSESGPVQNFSSSRLQTLLAYLLVHRHAPQPRQHVAFLLWPDSSEPQARTNLRVLLKELRRALPDSDTYLVSEGQSLQWRCDSPCTLDVDEFERAIHDAAAARAGDPNAERAALESALQLYVGDLLPSNYDDWVLVERERLQQMHDAALSRLIALLEACGDYRGAIARAQQQLRGDPLREDSYRLLMRLYALNGDRAGVQRVFNQCVSVLARDLSIEPSRETRSAYEQCLRMEPVAHPAPSALPPETSAPGGASTQPLPPPRRPETRWLRDALSYGVPVAGLAYSLLALHVPVALALPLSVVAFLGLYFLLNPRTDAELAQEDLRAELLAKLHECEAAVAQLRALAAGVREPADRAALARIADLAGQLVYKLRTEKFAGQREVQFLASLLADTSQIVDALTRLSDSMDESERVRIQADFSKFVGKTEAALKRFSRRLDWPALIELETAMRAMLATFSQDGLESGGERRP